MRVHGIRCDHCANVTNARREIEIKGTTVRKWHVCTWCGSQWPYLRPSPTQRAREQSLRMLLERAQADRARSEALVARARLSRPQDRA